MRSPRKTKGQKSIMFIVTILVRTCTRKQTYICVKRIYKMDTYFKDTVTHTYENIIYIDLPKSLPVLNRRVIVTSSQGQRGVGSVVNNSNQKN